MDCTPYQQYIGTKIVEAYPESRTFHELPRITGTTVFYDGTRIVAGYHVRYEDGYESWSPKDVFEKAYRHSDALNFGLALEAVKAGKKAAREGWNGKSQYIELATCISYKNEAGKIVNCEHDAIGNKAIAFVGTSGVQMGWLASQADMLADDWHIIE